MKDFLGNPLDVGDQVVFIDRGYRSYKRGQIVSFTPQKVRVRIDSVALQNLLKGWNLQDTILQEPTQLIKY